ncbi:MAG: DUF2500 domain-containing protein [Clostridia bacterium]|nr:DUF2500 domain-containing protein [Clostridia bacterium]
MSPFSFFDFSFTVVPILFVIFFIIFFVFFFIIIGKNIAQWNKNNHSPRITVPAKVITKRVNVSHRHHDHHVHTSSSYYVTFEVESGDRMELHMSGSEYGLLVEGDEGKLTFQGTRYLGFERN